MNRKKNASMNTNKKQNKRGTVEYRLINQLQGTRKETSSHVKHMNTKTFLFWIENLVIMFWDNKKEREILLEKIIGEIDESSS